MKANIKLKLKITIYAIILVLYIFCFGLVFNYKQILGIGYYHNEKNFTTTYTWGSGGLNIKIYALHVGYDDHNYGIELTAFSNPDSHLVGITYLDYRLGTNTVLKKVLTTNYSIPITTYSIGYTPPIRTRLYQNNNLTCKGFAVIIFNVNDINEVHTISFDIGIIIKFDGGVLSYELGNASIWFDVIYLTCTIIPLTLLYRSIKKFKFLKWYSEEIRERDELFLKTLSKKVKSPSNK